jgi:methionyl-tRNA synthetase
LREDWKELWNSSRIVQFMANDNVLFHSVKFPCTIFGCDGLPNNGHTFSSTEYLTFQGGKFSKSKGLEIVGSQIEDYNLTLVFGDFISYLLDQNDPIRHLVSMICKG